MVPDRMRVSLPGRMAFFSLGRGCYMSDDNIYCAPRILVTSSFVKINSGTYSIRNINSVNITRESIYKPISNMISILFGVIFMRWLFASNPVLYTTCNILTIISDILFMNYLYSALKPNYYLVFSISNGRTKALTAKSRNVLVPVKDAIETAFSRN